MTVDETGTQEQLELDTEVDDRGEPLEEDHEGEHYEELFDAAYGDKPSDDKDEDKEPEGEVAKGDDEDKEGLVEDEGVRDEKPGDPTDPYAWIEQLPEEQRAKAEALKHAAESDKGRVSAYNRRLSQLQQEVDRMRDTSRPSRTAGQDGQDNPDEPTAAPELPETFKQLKEDFPEFADAVADVREYDRKQFEKIVADRLQPLEDERAVTRRSQFWKGVTDGAEEIFNTQETGVDVNDVVKSENFLSWLELQPPSVQRAANTQDATEALNVLRRYESDYQHSVSQADESGAVNQEEQPTKEADAIQKKRTQRKKDGVAPVSKPAPGDVGAGGAGDYEAEFNAKWG